MKHLTVNNQEYTVTVHQQKNALPYLLMLHGFMSDQRVFSHLVDDLSHFCNPITVDLLGFGQTAKPDSPQRYQEKHQVADLYSLIQQLKPKPLFLYGYSMGGRLTLQMVSKHAELFKGLILESTNCGISDPEQRKARQQIDAERAQTITSNFEKFLAEWKNLDLFRSPLPRNEQLCSNYLKIQSEQSPPALAASLMGFGTGSMSPVCDKLKTITLPTLLIAGSADEKYQHINQHLSEQLPNATFSSIEAGHRIHLDNPTVLVDKINHFLNNL